MGKVRTERYTVQCEPGFGVGMSLLIRAHRRLRRLCAQGDATDEHVAELADLTAVMNGDGVVYDEATDRYVKVSEVLL